MSHFFNNLIALATARGLSIRAVSDGAGLPPSTLSRYIKRGPTANIRTSTVLAVSEFFAVSPEDMINKELLPPVDAVTLARLAPTADIDIDNCTPPSKPNMIPLVTPAMADDLIKQTDIPVCKDPDGLFSSGIEKVAPPVFPQLQSDDRLLAYRVNGNAMAPLIPNGSIVYFVRVSPGESIPDGTIVLASTAFKGNDIAWEYDDSPFIVVRKYSSDDLSQIWLSAINPNINDKYKSIQGGSIIGRVVAWCVKA